MTPLARALAVHTGDATLKLTLLCVAASAVWPTVDDIATAAEIPGTLAVAALDELVRRRTVVAQPSPDGTRYALAEDGWEFTRPDTGTPDEAPTDKTMAALRTGDIGGYPMGTRS